jgi:para-nitrobenzyl esterase
MSEDPIVQARQGRLRGRRDPAGVLRFQGVPFARPPIGALRFRPPQPPALWDGVRDAQAPGPVAPQAASLVSTARMDEDCLYLNVTTPAADDARRAVLVYVHGGAFIAGGGSAEAYSGVCLARDHDLVVVSLNYRLGVLGFPPFALFGEGSAQNLGLLDQIAALAWVRENIAAFGGDPERVTLAGYSAGGWSTAALMTAPAARGLFQRAAPQSGAFFRAMPPSGQAPHAKAFLNAMGLDRLDAEALVQAPVDRLLAAQAAAIEAWQARVMQSQAEELDFPFTPLLDGAVLAQSPLEAIRGGAGAEVPLLVGTTRDELGAAPFRMALPWMQAVHGHSSLVAALDAAHGAGTGARVWEGYARLHPGEAETVLAGRVRSDWLYRLPAIRLAEARRAGAAPAWMYRFDLGAPSAEVGGIATHATDAVFWFGSMDQSPYQTFFFGRAANEAERALSATMQADLAAFARDGACAWPAYDPARRATRIYDLGAGEADDPGGAERALWGDVWAEGGEGARP